LASENYDPGAIVLSCLRDPAFSRFDTVPACDRLTDGREDRHTDGQTQEDSKYRASIASRG